MGGDYRTWKVVPCIDCGMERRVFTSRTSAGHQRWIPRCRKCAMAIIHPPAIFRCAQCGKEKRMSPADLRTKKTPFCQECRGQKSQLDTNGIHWTMNTGGYMVRRIRGHPLASKGRGQLVLQHWSIMYDQSPIGPKAIIELRHRGFSIHHKNAVRHDNRIENLELRAPGMHPSGWSIERMAILVNSIGLGRCPGH